MITQDDLRAAAATISDMPAAAVSRRLSQLKELRCSRSSLAELRHQAEQDCAELEQAAYQLARRYHDDGNLTAAARWYRVAAANDYCDASFELAKVLDCLAERHLRGPASHMSTREEMDLVSQAARWYGAAYAAGHLESAELLDALVGRHDPERPRQKQPEAGHHEDEVPAGTCSLGGLTEVMQCQLTTATVHVSSCRLCQQELLEHGGILPIIDRLTRKAGGGSGAPGPG